MGKQFWAWCVAATLLSGPAWAQEFTPPTWIERPDAATFVQFYPPAALHQNVSGVVNLRCLVQLDTTAQCVAASETPSGWGFADAALAIARSFRMTPALSNGRPVEGGRVNVPIRFNFPYEPDPFPEEYQNLFALLPRDEVIELPIWDEAPNFAEVRQTFPTPWDEGFEARVLLSCQLRQDRRLADCAVERAFPGNVGAGEAALNLTDRFRVSERDAPFIARFSGRRFLLPLAFGGLPINTPVDQYLEGFSASAMPPPPTQVLHAYYPPQALAAGTHGAVILRCNSRGWTCSVIHESPAGKGFGEASLAFMRAITQGNTLGPSLPQEVYIPFLFSPPD